MFNVKNTPKLVYKSAKTLDAVMTEISDRTETKRS